MKKLVFAFIISCEIIALGAAHRNGTYRGVFVGGQETQVEVQFKLKDDVVSNARYRTLFYNKVDYLKEESMKEQKEKYEKVLASTEGQKLDEALEKLYKPEDIIIAGASVRGTKVRAAIQNAINGGVYTPE